MKRLIKEFQLLIADTAAVIRTRLAEVEHGITLMEAARSDEFQTALRALTATEEQREEIRQGALDVARMGFTADEFTQILRLYAQGKLCTPEAPNHTDVR